MPLMPCLCTAWAQALSPHYIFTYFIRNGLTGWESLGGLVLAITDAQPTCLRRMPVTWVTHLHSTCLHACSCFSGHLSILCC